MVAARHTRHSALTLAAPNILRYEEPLAAEAMRAHENNEEAALGVLSSPAGYEALQEALLAKSSENAARESSVATLVAMGFGRAAAATALKTANGDLQAAAAALSDAAPAAEASGEAMVTDDAAASAGGGGGGEAEAAPKVTEEDHRAIESSGLHAALAASQAAYEAPALAVEGAAIEVYVAAVEERLGAA